MTRAASSEPQGVKPASPKTIPKHQLNLPPSLLANETPGTAMRPKSTHPDDASILAAELFDQALTEAGITNDEAAYLLGVSASLVRRMRSRDARERASFVQLLRLPFSFHVALHRVMNRRLGLGRAMLREVLDALGCLAAVVGE